MEAETKDDAGIVYLSSIPPGMAPHDIRTHLSPFGKISRLYLAPLKQDTTTIDGESKRSKSKRLQKALLEPHKLKTKFTEGWVEFDKKADAKTAALALNGTPVRSSNPRHRDSLWCVKYLSGFRWVNLTEQLNLARASRDKRLQAERRQARRENEHYLAQVEKAQARKRAEAKKLENVEEKTGEMSKEEFEDVKIKFKQRKPILN